MKVVTVVQLVLLVPQDLMVNKVLKAKLVLMVPLAHQDQPVTLALQDPQDVQDNQVHPVIQDLSENKVQRVTVVLMVPPVLQDPREKLVLLAQQVLLVYKVSKVMRVTLVIQDPMVLQVPPVKLVTLVQQDHKDQLDLWVLMDLLVHPVTEVPVDLKVNKVPKVQQEKMAAKDLRVFRVLKVLKVPVVSLEKMVVLDLKVKQEHQVSRVLSVNKAQPVSKETLDPLDPKETRDTKERLVFRVTGDPKAHLVPKETRAVQEKMAVMEERAVLDLKVLEEPLDVRVLLQSQEEWDLWDWLELKAAQVTRERMVLLEQMVRLEQLDPPALQDHLELMVLMDLMVKMAVLVPLVLMDLKASVVTKVKQAKLVPWA